MAGTAGIPEVNIGMVGHVDHGKTTLTMALTGKWTDTHSEERKRGITIRLGYADVTLYKCGKCEGAAAYGNAETCATCAGAAERLRTASIVDAPGHETLMTTMLAGAAVMDGAILVIGANEPCPQPQTREHLTVLEISGIKNVVVVQNKVDLVTEAQARENHRQIQQFLKGSIAESAPIIPVSAQQRVNLDALFEAIEARIPTPKRDPAKPPKLLVARSFDINKPGTPIAKLGGGILGGSLVQGELKVGDEIEIVPGVKVKDAFVPLRTKVVGLHKAMAALPTAGPGGLLGVATELDPAIAKSDSLSGTVAGKAGQLPPVRSELAFASHLLERVVGAKEELKVEPVKLGEPLLLTVGISRTVGAVTAAAQKRTVVKLKIPVAAEAGERIAISRQVAGRWRLIGWGELL